MKKKQTIDEVMDSFFVYMRGIGRSERALSRYRRKWQGIKGYMLSKNIRLYNKKVGQSYLKHLFGNFDYHQLGESERNVVNITEALSEFQETGRMIMGARKLKPKLLRGPWAACITSFIDHKRLVIKLSENTLGGYRFHLYPFCNFMDIHKLSIELVKPSDFLAYVEQMDSDRVASKYVALNILRGLLSYLYAERVLTTDYSGIVPKNNYKHQPKLPSTYTDEEIYALLESVDRGNPKGKRDYAMLLLATRLGLRASDICGLTFDNILWERNMIRLDQQKTGRLLELPLLPEIGNALVDYLKHGRPVTEDRHCFIHVQGPYEGLHSHDIGNMVRKYMTLAKINYSNRRHGSHCLRHSLANALLREHVPLPVISGILGHTGMESTMEYLRIDIVTLKKCALEVPSVPVSFYEQKGGYSND